LGEEARSLVFALHMRAELRSARGEYKQAFDDVETCYRLGRHWAANKDLLSRLVGYASRGVSLETIRTILAHEEIDASLLSHVQGLLQRFAQDDVSGCDLTEDRFMAMDVIQCTFTDDGKGGGRVPRVAFKKHLIRDGQLEPAIAALCFGREAEIGAWKELDRRTTTSDVHKYYDLAEKACLLSPWQYERYYEKVKLEIDILRAQNVLIRTFSPAIERLVGIAGRARVDRDATIAILAVLRYQADNGNLPESLAELVSDGYLKAVPQDVFDLGPLIYRRSNEDFLLYSFGADFDDDGGTPSKWGDGPNGGDQVFWPVRDSEPLAVDDSPPGAD